MSSKDADFATWIERNPPLSLAELLKKYGSYGAISKHAWRDFEADYAYWEERAQNAGTLRGKVALI
jgi:hypothetical protein